MTPLRRNGPFKPPPSQRCVGFATRQDCDIGGFGVGVVIGAGAGVLTIGGRLGGIGDRRKEGCVCVSVFLDTSHIFFFARGCLRSPRPNLDNFVCCGCCVCWAKGWVGGRHGRVWNNHTIRLRKKGLAKACVE